MLKKFVTLAMVLTMAGLSNAALMGFDEASNYADWTNGSNEGTGFAAWDIWITDIMDQAGTFLDPSHLGLIDSANNTSFGMWGTGGWLNARRMFADSGTLDVGQAFLIDMSLNWRDGGRGIDIVDSAQNKLWGFHVDGTAYSDTGWDWVEHSAISLRVDQINETQFQVSALRLNDSATWISDPINGVMGGFKAYVGGTTGGGDCNFYINNMAVIPEPSTMAVMGLGIVGLFIARKLRRA